MNTIGERSDGSTLDILAVDEDLENDCTQDYILGNRCRVPKDSEYCAPTSQASAQEEPLSTTAAVRSERPQFLDSCQRKGHKICVRRPSSLP